MKKTILYTLLFSGIVFLEVVIYQTIFAPHQNSEKLLRGFSVLLIFFRATGFQWFLFVQVKKFSFGSSHRPDPEPMLPTLFLAFL